MRGKSVESDLKKVFIQGDKVMNNEMAYLLGMITGNGEIQRGATETTILIEIPHKKLETEFQRDVGIYVKASITDIRQILEPLLGTSLKFIQNPNISVLSFTKPNEDYLMREVLRYIGHASSTDTIRISPDSFCPSDPASGEYYWDNS